MADIKWMSFKKMFARSKNVIRRPTHQLGELAPVTTTPRATRRGNWNADPVNTPVETVPTLPCPRMSVRRRTTLHVATKPLQFHRTRNHANPFCKRRLYSCNSLSLLGAKDSACTAPVCFGLLGRDPLAPIQPADSNHSDQWLVLRCFALETPPPLTNLRILRRIQDA